MNRDLFLAILAMDSYNRGYSQGISNLPNLGLIGNATIIDIPLPGGSEAAGFYALAYDVSGVKDKDDNSLFTPGETVISYRGTDNLNLLNDSSNDILNGWLIGGGAQGFLVGDQAPLSIEFYKAVVGTDASGQFTANPFTSNITLTGHSLGGGLAGYVASLYGRSGDVFDNMPFEFASYLTRLRAQANELTGFGYAKDFVYGQYDITELDRSKIEATAVSLEVLASLRAIGGQATPVDSIDTHGSAFLNPATQRHMMDLLVNLMWARDNDKTAWQDAGVELWGSYFDQTVAESISGIASRQGSTGAIGVMGRAIAYSALENGERPFGDTGIWSMFNDADELGTVLAGDEAAFFGKFVTEHPGPTIPYTDITLYDPDQDVKKTLANMLVQYAGALALYDVEQSQSGSITVEGGTVDAREGVLSLRAEDSALAVDLSRQLWGEVLKSNAAAATKLTGDQLAPIDRTEFRQAFFKQAEDPGLWSAFKRLLHLDSGTQFSDADLAELAKEIWETDNLNIFDRFHMAPTDNATTVTLDARGYLSNTSLGDKAQVDVYIGTAANERIINNTTGHNFIITGGGDDTVDAGGGNDVVYSQGGADDLGGGDGNDQVFALNGTGAVTAGGDAAATGVGLLLGAATGNLPNNIGGADNDNAVAVRIAA